MPQPLPVDAVLPAVLASLREHRAAVLTAPPGSGKTTRLPPALLDSGLLGTGNALVLQPRRVATRLAARRVAQERGEPVGRTVGYSTRFERKTSRDTRIEFITEGLLTRRLQQDPFLDGVSCVVFDEFHERSLHTDLAFSLCAEVVRSVRDDLSLAVLSATLDPVPVSRFLNDCPIHHAEGRVFPVAVEHEEARGHSRLELRVARVVRRLLNEEREGHVLVFLPGVGEINRCRQALVASSPTLPGDVVVHALHGRLPGAEQDRVLAPSAQRKVVLATNVAETSVTLDGLRSVVDSGLVRIARFDAVAGADRLETRRISRASADQRAGRAGRVGPGRCVRLWGAAEDQQLPEHEQPAVRRLDLSRAALELRAWGSTPQDFRWFERPPETALEQADSQLRGLGAIDEQGLTPRGRDLLRLPLTPRLGTLLLTGAAEGAESTAATAAALIAERDPFGRRGVPDTGNASDLLDRVAAVASSERGRGGDGLHAVRKVRDQLLRALRSMNGPDKTGTGTGTPTTTAKATATATATASTARATASTATATTPSLTTADAPPLTRALLAALPDRLALQRAPDSLEYRLASGRGARLSEDSAARGARLLVAVDLSAARKGQRSEAVIRMAHALEEHWLHIIEEDGPRFDPQREAVVQRRLRRIGPLVLAEFPSSSAMNAAEAEAMLLHEARRQPDRALSPDPDALQLAARITLLRVNMPELELPEVRWADLLPVLVAGKRRFEQLRQARLAPALLQQLTWPQRTALEKHAPARARLPTGSTAAIDYVAEGGPVLAARMQQLFGLTSTPVVAAGRVPLTLHLLAPNNRPSQVTKDLAGFWERTWPELRKELRGRYPKHAWPEDPLTATPQDRPKRRRPRK